MSFFEPPPPPPDPAQRHVRPSWIGPPEGEIGVPTDLQAVLVRSAELIIVADRFVCYALGSSSPSR